MPLPIRSSEGSNTGTVIPIFKGSSTEYGVDEFLKRFNDQSNRAELTGEEKFARVFDFIDISLESVMSIIRTCSYNDWSTFERMFRTAYYSQSSAPGLPYVEHLIKTFQGTTTPEFGIHIFLECFFAYTDTLCKKSLMSYGQRFSLLTFALPPTYISFLRAYSSEANEWLSGMPSDVPTSDSKWARLIDLTKQYAVDQEIFIPEKHSFSRLRSSSRKKKRHELSHNEPATRSDPTISVTSVNNKTHTHQYDDDNSHFGHFHTPVECDLCGSRLSNQRELPDLDEAFLRASQASGGLHPIRHTPGSAPSSIASPSILSTPSEYLTPLGASGIKRGKTSAESVRNFALTRAKKMMGPSHVSVMAAPPQPLIDKEKHSGATLGSPTIIPQIPHARGVLKRNPPSSSSRRNDSTTTANTIFSLGSAETGMTRNTSPTIVENEVDGSEKTLANNDSNFNFFDIINEYESVSNLNEGIDSPKRSNSPATVKEAEVATRNTGLTEAKETPKKKKSPLDSIDDEERRIWGLFFKAHQKAQRRQREKQSQNQEQKVPKPEYSGDHVDAELKAPNSPALSTTSYISNGSDEIYNIDDILASRLDLDDSDDETAASASEDEQEHSIPIDIIMAQFADPELTSEQEAKLVETYAEQLTCYRMSEFKGYPEKLLNHVFEVVLGYMY